MIQSISFIILHLNSKAEDLQLCRQSIEAQKIPDFDVHVLSPASTQNLTSALNHKCASIKKDYIVLMDSNVILDGAWYTYLKNADFFDLIGESADVFIGDVEDLCGVFGDFDWFWVD